MLSTCNKPTKTKSNSNKKSRKPPCAETEAPGILKLSNNLCNVGIQTMENKVGSSELSRQNSKRDSSIRKSLENIMNFNNNDKLTMSETDISFVYGMYKNLVQKNRTNNDIHTENYRILLTEIQKIQSQMYEQEKYHKSILKLITSMESQQRMERRMRRKRSNKVNKMLILKFSQISSMIYKLNSFIETAENKNVTTESKIEEFEKATPSEKAQTKEKKLKKSIFFWCI